MSRESVCFHDTVIIMRVESQCACMIYSYNYESRESVCFHDTVIIMRVESQCASMIQL